MAGPKSAGLFQRFEDYSQHLDLVHQMRTRGLSREQAEKLGFRVERQGDYIPAARPMAMSPMDMDPAYYQQGFQQAADQHGAKRRTSPDMGFTRQRQREDLEEQYRPKTKPKMF